MRKQFCWYLLAHFTELVYFKLLSVSCVCTWSWIIWKPVALISNTGRSGNRPWSVTLTTKSSKEGEFSISSFDLFPYVTLSLFHLINTFLFKTAPKKKVSKKQFHQILPKIGCTNINCRGRFVSLNNSLTNYCNHRKQNLETHQLAWGKQPSFPWPPTLPIQVRSFFVWNALWRSRSRVCLVVALYVFLKMIIENPWLLGWPVSRKIEKKTNCFVLDWFLFNLFPSDLK